MFSFLPLINGGFHIMEKTVYIIHNNAYFGEGWGDNHSTVQNNYFIKLAALQIIGSTSSAREAKF